MSRSKRNVNRAFPLRELTRIAFCVMLSILRSFIKDVFPFDGSMRFREWAIKRFSRLFPVEVEVEVLQIP